MATREHPHTVNQLHLDKGACAAAVQASRPAIRELKAVRINWAAFVCKRLCCWLCASALHTTRCIACLRSCPGASIDPNSSPAKTAAAIRSGAACFLNCVTMGHEDTDIPAASLCLIDPRPSLESSQCIHFDVYGAMALAASGTISDVVAAARKETVVVFFHGGGFAAGNKNQYCAFLRRLAATTNCTVMACNYSLAPEHPFPSGLCDCFAAVTAVLLHLRPKQLVLAGDSAGGNLAIATSMMLLHPQFCSPQSRSFSAHPSPHVPLHVASFLADTAACFQLASEAMGTARPRHTMLSEPPASPGGTTRLVALLMLYPCLDPSLGGSSHVAHAFSPTLSSSELKWFWKQYVPDYCVDANNTASPLYSILNAGDDVLRALPACFIATAGQDPLHDDGVSLFRRLQALGVTVQHHHEENASHGFVVFPDALPCVSRHARRCLAAIGEWAQAVVQRECGV